MKQLFDASRHPELTYNDVFIVPNNPLEQELEKRLSPQEFADLMTAFAEYKVAVKESRRAWKRYGRSSAQAAPLQDAALEAARTFEVKVLGYARRFPELTETFSRDKVDITPADGFGNTPIVVSNMNAVTGFRMAEIASRMGGSAAIPQDKEDGEMESIIRGMKEAHPVYDTPIYARPDMKVFELQQYLNKRDFDAAVVLNDQRQLAGIISEADVKGVDPDKPIRSFIREQDIVTGHDGITAQEAVVLMEQKHIHFLPIVRAVDGVVVGAWTREKAAYQLRYKPHTDPDGRLAVLATVGAVNKDPVGRAKKLIEWGADGIVLDTAHFDQGVLTYMNLEAVCRSIEEIQTASGRRIFVAAGNVISPDAARRIFAAGADAAKVGVGPGAMCETRMEAGVGRPQFTAVRKTVDVANDLGKHVWADGGIKYPRDVALALAAGASQVMVGSLFTPSIESPADYDIDEHGKKYKVNWGMASRKAASARKKAMAMDMLEIFRKYVGQRSEGTSHSRVYPREGQESAAGIIHNIMDGVTSAVRYVNGRNLEDLHRNAHVGLQSASGYAEGMSHKELK